MQNNTSSSRWDLTSTRAVVGWITAAIAVVAPLAEPQLTSQSVPALVQLRHHVLMMIANLSGC
jgi:hypothetical protein